MKKISLLFSLILLFSSCFWDKSPGRGDNTQYISPSSNVYSILEDLGSVQIHSSKSKSFSVKNSFDEDADVILRLASNDGMTDASVLSVTPNAVMGNCYSKDGYFTIPPGEECEYSYTFTPKERRYYTNVVSIDIIGKSFYEKGDTSKKRRTDIYFEGAGVDGVEKTPSDFVLNFNGINKYLVSQSPIDGAPIFQRDVLAANIKNESGNSVTYDLVAGDGETPYDVELSEFKLVADSLADADCKVSGNSFSVEAGKSCSLRFQYVPVSKTERGQIYLNPRDGSPSKRIFFYGAAYPLRLVKSGEELDWGKVGVNLKPADTLLDLDGRIKRGEELTANFDNPFFALIRVTPASPDDKVYWMDFDKHAGFSIDKTLTDCSIDENKVNVKDGGCDIVISFEPDEAKAYGSVSLTLTSEKVGTVDSYSFRGESILMKRPFIGDFTWILYDNMTINRRVGETAYLVKDLAHDSLYSFSGDGAFNIEEHYPGCIIDGTMFRLNPETNSCRIYISYTPTEDKLYSSTFVLDDVTYNLTGGILK